MKSSYESNGVTYDLMKDGYMRDPTGLLSADVHAMSGVKKFILPIAIFQTDKGKAPDRMYVRAFAQTAQHDKSKCESDLGRRQGACIRRYAYSNPVWAVASSGLGVGKCEPGPRTIDRDGDGLGDGCDPCPDDKSNRCVGAAKKWIRETRTAR